MSLASVAKNPSSDKKQKANRQKSAWLKRCSLTDVERQPPGKRRKCNLQKTTLGPWMQCSRAASDLASDLGRSAPTPRPEGVRFRITRKSKPSSVAPVRDLRCLLGSRVAACLETTLPNLQGLLREELDSFWPQPQSGGVEHRPSSAAKDTALTAAVSVFLGTAARFLDEGIEGDADETKWIRKIIW